MFKRLRIAILLYVLVFVALGQFLTARRSTDWNQPLWVDVFPVNARTSDAVQSYVESLDANAFAAVEAFLAGQAADYGVALQQPFRIRLAEQVDQGPPALPDRAGMMTTALWSLRMRWFLTRLHFSRDGPAPDITVFAVYHDGDHAGGLDRSTALRKGMVAIANLYAVRRERGTNQVVVAHELLHTLGATDKYDLATNLPTFPEGYVEPQQEPLYPQRKAELMGGRVPVSAGKTRIPESLREVVVGPLTATEIGWLR